MTKIVGQLYQLGSSKSVEAVISLIGDNTICISFDEDKQHFESQQINISSRLGNSARYIDIAEFGRFETPDNDAVDTLHKQIRGSKPGTLLHRLEANLSLIIIAVVVTAVFVWVSLTYGIPIVSDKIVAALPARTADLLEDKFFEEIDENWFSESKLSEQRQGEVNDLYAQVAASMGVNPEQQNFRFYLRNAEDSVGANALALPSGTIIMTDQLVMAADSDKQIAGVIAHELGHVLGQHSMKQIVRGSLLTFIVALIAGDVAGASSTIVAAPVVLMELRYSRDLELEADQYAIDYFDCDVEGLREMGKFFFELSESISDEKIAKTASDDNAKDKPKSKGVDSVTEYLSTHPSNSERQRRFERTIKDRCQA